MVLHLLQRTPYLPSITLQRDRPMLWPHTWQRIGSCFLAVPMCLPVHFLAVWFQLTSFFVELVTFDDEKVIAFFTALFLFLPFAHCPFSCRRGHHPSTKHTK